jgi:hypothetical protein
MPPRAADLVHDPAHAGPLSGATAVGSAAAGDREVRVGLWLDAAGRIERARFRATTCASLIAYAEAACRLAEAAGSADLPADRLRAAVAGVHPAHLARADLVALALASARDRRSHDTTGAAP